MTEQEQDKMAKQIRKEFMKEFVKGINDLAKRIRKKPNMVKRGNLKYIIWKLKNKTI